MDNKLLEVRIKALENRVADLEKYVATLDNAESLIDKPLEEKIIDTIIKSVYQHYDFYYSSDEKAMIRTQVILDQTGFVSLDIDGSRAFIYALHPSKFIESNDLWDFVQNNIKREYAITLCIGLFEVGKPQGIQISKKFDDALIDLRKRI